MVGVSFLLIGAAFLRPLPRVTGFILCIVLMVIIYHKQVLTSILATELGLYLLGAVFFLRNGGHARRFTGLQDHHALHYLVTIASALHVKYLLNVA